MKGVVPMYRLAHFVNEDTQQEFVVILTPETKVSEFATNGFTLLEELPIDGDASGMPCDRQLSD
jgi:hypothetical protein